MSYTIIQCFQSLKKPARTIIIWAILLDKQKTRTVAENLILLTCLCGFHEIPRIYDSHSYLAERMRRNSGSSSCTIHSFHSHVTSMHRNWPTGPPPTNKGRPCLNNHPPDRGRFLGRGERKRSFAGYKQC